MKFSADQKRGEAAREVAFRQRVYKSGLCSEASTRDQGLAPLNRLLTEYAETHESALRPRAVKDRGARKRREAEARAETCEAEMTAMRTISTLVSELTTSIAITVMICGLMMMALG